MLSATITCINILSRMEQLGPFKFFWTVSCADQRWREIPLSMKLQKGGEAFVGKVGISTEDDGSKTIEESEVLIDGELLEDLLEHENIHDMVKTDVLTVVRCFQQRLSALKRHIIFGPGSPFNPTYICGRTEFQKR